MTAHDVEARQVVVLPLWANAALDQLSAPERAQVAASLERFANGPNLGDLHVVRSSALPDASANPDGQRLYELRAGQDLRVLLLHRQEAGQYEVVGIRRRSAG